jgi:AbrB family looped-hinge helix DNA binding protein
MSLLKIGPRGQITLPKKLRESLGLSPGDSLALFQRADVLILRPVKDTLLDLRGSVTVKKPQDFQAIRAQVKKAVGQKATKRDA